ncbi:MAG: hypothetical protein IJA97_04270 [Clostridia bacterium]|nr:hypothetical protein [Clostridia bacterium]
MLIDFQKLFLGIKPKKSKGTLTKALKPLNLAQAPKSYKKKYISHNYKQTEFDYSYEKTYLFATKYHNTFTETATFSRNRYVKKEKNGKVTKWGPWVYNTMAGVRFHALDLTNYPKTKAKLQELYPDFSFWFTKEYVEVYVSRSVKNLKGCESVIKDFARKYLKEASSLVDSMNYAHDQIHKK